jgi:TonB family protein
MLEGSTEATINGTVVLAVVVGADGLLHDISVVAPVGYGLDEEAVKAVKKWRFKPGKSSGQTRLHSDSRRGSVSLFCVVKRLPAITSR